MKAAIIGAGLTGALIASRLSKKYDITLFDKSRGVAGRLATRYAGDFAFDHGAPVIHAHDLEFIKFLLSLGVVEPWQPKVAILDKQSHLTSTKETTCYVAAPKMNSLCKRLVQTLNVKLNTRVCEIKASGIHNQLFNEANNPLGEFDWVICTTPSNQAYELMPRSFTHKQTLSAVKMVGCISVMLGFDSPLSLPFDIAELKGSSISRIIVNSNKPGRNSFFTLVIQASHDWSEQNIERSLEDIQKPLIEYASQLLNRDLFQARHIDLHRWRYAGLSEPNDIMALVDEKNRLIACGDWCGNGGAESAFDSACYVSNLLVQKL